MTALFTVIGSFKNLSKTHYKGCFILVFITLFLLLFSLSGYFRLITFFIPFVL